MNVIRPEDPTVLLPVDDSPDDEGVGNGKHWRAGKPFPMNGTGEGVVAEFTGEQIDYTSRNMGSRNSPISRSEKSG